MREVGAFLVLASVVWSSLTILFKIMMWIEESTNRFGLYLIMFIVGMIILKIT